MPCERNAAFAFSHAKQALKKTLGEDAGFEARLIIAHILSVRPAQLPLFLESSLTYEQECALHEILKRRMEHEPLQYIFGEWEFMGLPFMVNQSALIPRADTEVLAELALSLIKERGYQKALDLCCGTGCIGISLAKLAGISVTASDISPACVALTKQNAYKNAIHISVLQGSFFAPVDNQYDLIVSNPPYLTGKDMQVLQEEVKWEPALALYGGEDGLDAYRVIAREYKKYLRPGGVLLLEAGANQAKEIASLFQSEVRVHYDYNGIPRVICVFM